MSEAKTIAEVIAVSEDRFKAVAPQFMSYEAEKGFALQCLQNNDYLMGVAKSSPKSLQYAITNVAAIGLSLNPAEKLAYLIPRSIKVNGKYQSRIFLEPSYMGLCKLATDSGSIKWVQANAVYSQDTFIDNGPGEKPTHQYEAFKPRGDFAGVYCVAKTGDGDYLTTIMPADEVNSIKARSEHIKNNKPGPWLSDFVEQAKKSVVRRAFKMWPRTDERRMARLAQAVMLSNENEGFEPMVSEPQTHGANAEQKNYFDALIENNDGLNMFAFSESLRRSSQDSVFTNLYHSFPKGEKGKYQRVVDGLVNSGRSTYTAILDELTEAAAENDEMRARENLEGLSHDVIALLSYDMPRDVWAAVNDMAQAAA